MKGYCVKDLMVPLSEYATVREGATLYEAVLALEKAQEEYDRSKYQHRAILVLDKQNRVVGKLSQMDVLRAIEFEPDDDHAYPLSDLREFQFSRQFLNSLVRDRPLKNEDLRDLCRKAAAIKVEKIMQAPVESEYVAPDTSLANAIHQMVVGQHQFSLLVARDTEIVGILRLADAFGAIFHTMKNCAIDVHEVAP